MAYKKRKKKVKEVDFLAEFDAMFLEAIELKTLDEYLLENLQERDNEMWDGFEMDDEELDAEDAYP